MRFRAAIAVGAAAVAASASVSAGEGSRLTWAPPALSDPVVISVSNANRRLYLDDARDYRLNIVEHLKRELWIEGGRHVVVVGGHITIDQLGRESAYQDNTAIKVRNGAAGGIVHLEGLLVDGAHVADGIAIATPRSVQVENVRVERAFDGIKGAHADCVQVQQGVGDLRVDRFTCSTERQGFFLGDHDGPIRSVELRHVNLLGAPGAHLLWQSSPTYDISISDMWLGIAPNFKPWAPFGWWVYPQKDGRTVGGQVDRRRRSVVSRDGSRLWFVGSRISGIVRKNRIAAGDFVPASLPGVEYTSPGYAPTATR